jgi:hypothetical protein
VGKEGVFLQAQPATRLSAKEGFTPWQHNNLNLVEEYRAEFDAQGARRRRKHCAKELMPVYFDFSDAKLQPHGAEALVYGSLMATSAIVHPKPSFLAIPPSEQSPVPKATKSRPLGTQRVAITVWLGSSAKA